MNTIKIYFNENGTIERLSKDFPLYQGAYQNKLLNVFIPTSILQPEISVSENGEIVAESIAGTAVKIGMTYTARNGKVSTSEPRLMRFLKTLTYQNVEYALYERMLPQEFTIYAGQGENAPVLNVSAVVVDFESDPATILRIITTQTCSLDVMPSSTLDSDVEEASTYDEFAARIDAIESDMTEKQDIQDATIDSDIPQTVVGAINAVNSKSNSNASAINTNTSAITQLQSDVEELQSKIAGAEVPVGSMSGTSLPTNAQLTAYTVAQTGEQPQPNNVIIFTLEVTGGTDRVFKYIYVNQTDGWMSYEIPALEHASNGTYGSIQGTYSVDSTNNILINMMNGEIVDIYYKDNNGTYQNIQSSINLIKGNQDGILAGTMTVGKAAMAIRDQLGNVINTTYAQANDVYTKTQSDDKYLPKTYTNIYYYATDGLVDDVPTTPASGIQFTETVDTIGETLICDVSRTTTGDYHFTKNSSDNSSIVLATNVNCQLQFRLETYANNTLLAVDLSDTLQFVANTPQTLDITSIYNSLGTTEIDVPSGSTIKKKLYAISTDTTSKTVNLYSNATYPSTYQLNTQSIVLTINTINGLKAVNIAQSEWVANNDNTYTVTIPQTRHQQPASTRYVLELQKQVTASSYQYIAFTPIVNDAGDVTITTNEAIDCVLLIGASLSIGEKGVLTVTNPTAAQEIDYNLYGAMRVVQTNVATSLSLLSPVDTSRFYTFIIANDSNSTETINWNGEDITVGRSLQFIWNGANWTLGEQPTNTTDIYDETREQLLSTTLNQFETSINANTTNKANANLSNVTTATLNSVLPATNIDTWGAITVTDYYTTAEIPYTKAVVVFDLSAPQSISLETSNSNNVKEIRLKAIPNNNPNIVSTGVEIYAGLNTTINNSASTIGLYGATDGDLGTLYYGGVTNGVTNWIFEPAKHDNTIYIKGTNLSISDVAARVPYSQVIANGWTNLYTYNNSGAFIVSDNQTAKALKVYVNLKGQTAPSDGDVIIKFGTTTIATKSYRHNDTMTSFAGALIVDEVIGGWITIETTFTQSVTVDWNVCAMDIEAQKSSPINNQFDIDTGTQWDINYTNKTITLKE